MGVVFNVAEAKAKLSELIARAEAGEEVTIARDGAPAVTLTPVKRARLERREIGWWDHLNLNIPDDLFFEPDPEMEAWAERPIFRSGADD